MGYEYDAFLMRKIGGTSIVVNNSFMEKYGLTLEQLHEDAMQSAPLVRPMVIEGMATVLAKSLGAEDIGMLGLDIPPEQEQMFVATVKENTHGASVLAYEDFMDKATEKLGGECLGLTWDDVDYDRAEIGVNRNLVYYPDSETRKFSFRINTPKTEAGKRTVPIYDMIEDALRIEKENQLSEGGLSTAEVDGVTGFIFQNRFGDVVNPQSVNRTIKRVVRDYNSTEVLQAKKQKRDPLLLPEFSCHIFRHTFATNLCEVEDNLKVIQSVMGHKNIETTMDIYAEATDSGKREALNKLASKLNGMF